MKLCKLLRSKLMTTNFDAVPHAPICSSVCAFKRQGDGQIQQHEYKQYNRKHSRMEISFEMRRSCRAFQNKCTLGRRPHSILLVNDDVISEGNPSGEKKYLNGYLFWWILSKVYEHHSSKR